MLCGRNVNLPKSGKNNDLTSRSGKYYSYTCPTFIHFEDATLNTSGVESVRVSPTLGVDERCRQHRKKHWFGKKCDVGKEERMYPKTMKSGGFYHRTW